MDALLTFGKQHQAAGRLPEAAECYRQALVQRPDDREAMRQLAVVEYRMGNIAQAARWFGKLAQAGGNSADDFCNWGMLLNKLGRREESIAALRQALVIRPEFPEALYNLGVSLRESNRLGEAIEVYRRSVALQPGNAEAHNNLGNALCQVRQFDESIQAFGRSIALRPQNSETHYNLAICYHLAGKISEARASFNRAIELNPDSIDPYNNLGAMLLSLGEVDESERVFRRGLARDPQAAMLHWDLSQVLLLRGEYSAGWKEYEWRRRVPEFLPFTAEFDQPMWDGSDLRDKTILLYGEQGFGDTIHFARYVPLAAKRARKIVVACQPMVLRVISSLENVEQFVSPLDRLPDFQVHCPLPSLPSVLGATGPEHVPWNGAYLKSSEENRAKFVDCLREGDGKLKVGLVWCGRALPAGRSIPLKMLGRLASPRVQFYSLQVGEGSEEAGTPPPGMKLIDVTARFGDFADTAGLIDQLDLVIGIDTAVVQLAGALGKPVWTLLKRWPDWRWLLDGQDSPWYPTMRLFRQTSNGQWGDVVEKVSVALKSLIGE
jgi:tetratricopeptide (TPR) repeat protein